MQKNTFIRVIAAFVLLMTMSITFAASVQWHSYSKSAFATAKAQNKLVLIYGKSESCHWCSKMNSDTLSNSEVSALIAKKYVPVTIDVVTDRALASQYEISGTPTFIILDGNHKKVNESFGYQSVSSFKSFLESSS